MAEGGGSNGSPALPESFAATLAGLAASVGVDADDGKAKKNGKGGDADVDVSAAATYLAPQIARLAELEKDLPDFPVSPTATPWFKIENEYLDPACAEALSDIVHRHGGTKAHAYGWSKKRRWKERRAVILEIQARMTSSATMLALGARVSGTRKKIGEEEETSKTLALLDRTLAVYEAQLESGQVQVKPADVDKIVRLAKFLRGHAESIKEHRLAVTPETVRAAAKDAMRGLGDIDLELAGVVQDAEFSVQGDDADEDCGDPASLPAPSEGDSEGSESSEQAPPPGDGADGDPALEGDGSETAQNGGASSSSSDADSPTS